MSKNIRTCTVCSGSGAVTETLGSARRVCGSCGGTGKVVITVTENQVKVTRVLQEG